MSAIYPNIMTEKRYWSTPASACCMGNHLDSEIVDFVKALNSFHWMVTTSCCSGHDDKDAYVSVAIKASAMKQFVLLLNRLSDSLAEKEIYLDCSFIFERSIATSCDFENFPGLVKCFIWTSCGMMAFDTSETFWAELAATGLS